MLFEKKGYFYLLSNSVPFFTNKRNAEVQHEISVVVSSLFFMFYAFGSRLLYMLFVLVVVFSDNIQKPEPVLSYKTKVVW